MTPIPSQNMVWARSDRTDSPGRTDSAPLVMPPSNASMKGHECCPGGKCYDAGHHREHDTRVSHYRNERTP